MYGRDMGTLSVLHNETQLWTKTGDQGDTWHSAEIDIGTSTKNYKVQQRSFWDYKRLLIYFITIDYKFVKLTIYKSSTIHDNIFSKAFLSITHG